MYLINAWRHFITITQHKILVMKGCFQIGLYRQGIMHDLSKYSWSEFSSGVKYYQGNRSPNAAEREKNGYSQAWMHHKGRNKHHYEYWTDATMEKKESVLGVKMPLRYVAEMFIDRVAASKVYKKNEYTDLCPWEYYKRTRDYTVINPETRKLLEYLTKMLAVKGEDYTYRYIRCVLLPKGRY